MPPLSIRFIALAGLLAFGSVARAQVFENPRAGYAFDAPEQWRLVNPDFMIESPSGASIMESELPPHGVRTLDRISKAAGMIACIGADYEATSERFDVSGDRWNGLVTVYQEPRRRGREARHVLQLVAQNGDSYHLFYYAVPTREWAQGKEPALQVLRSLRFGV